MDTSPLKDINYQFNPIGLKSQLLMYVFAVVIAILAVILSAEPISEERRLFLQFCGFCLVAGFIAMLYYVRRKRIKYFKGYIKKLAELNNWTYQDRDIDLTAISWPIFPNDRIFRLRVHYLVYSENWYAYNADVYARGLNRFFGSRSHIANYTRTFIFTPLSAPKCDTGGATKIYENHEIRMYFLGGLLCQEDGLKIIEQL